MHKDSDAEKIDAACCIHQGHSPFADGSLHVDRSYEQTSNV